MAGSKLLASLFIMRSLLLMFSILSPAYSLSVASTMKAEWIKLDPISKMAPRRSGHVAFTTTDDRLFVFGGYAEEDKEGETMERYVVNDLWEWKDKEWTQCQQKSQIPGPRLASAATVLNGKYAYLMGGWDPQTPGSGGVILDTVHKLNLETMEWTELPANIPDGPTSRHVVLTLPGGSKALLHNHRCSDHVWIFDGETETFQKQATSGTAPSSRGLHCATIAGNNAVIFGGAAQSGTMSNEAFLLNTETWKWTPVTLSGDCPSPRAGASLCRYSDGCVLLFGGAEATEAGLNPRGDVWELIFDAVTGEGQWKQILDDAETSNSPTPRNAATLCPVEGEGGSCFLLTGGWAPFRQTWNDCYMLRVE